MKKTDWKQARRVRIIKVDTWETIGIADSVTQAAEITGEDSKLVSYICGCTNSYDITDDCLTFMYADNPSAYQKKCYYFRKMKASKKDLEDRCEDNT